MQKLFTLVFFVRGISNLNPSRSAKPGLSILTFVLLLMMMPSKSFANIIVTAPANGQNICSIKAANGSSSAYTKLNTITISEENTNSGDFGFSTGSTLVLKLSAPSGWQFNTSSVLQYNFTSGRNISAVGTALNGLTSTTLTINVTGKKTDLLDAFTIDGLEVQPITTGSSNGNITASSATNFTGIITGSAGTNFATLSIQSAVTPSVTIAASQSGTVCSGTLLTFTPTIVNGGSTPTFQWKLNGSVATTGTTFTSSSLTNGDQVSVIMTSSATCVSPPTATSNIITASINPLPQGSLTANGPFCATGTGQLTWTATAGTGPFTLVYNDGVANRTQPNVISGTPFDISANPLINSTTYTLVSVTDNNGCKRNSGFTGSSATITINPLPEGSLTANGPFCATGTGQLTWTATAGTGPFTVVYNDGVSNRTQTNVNSGMPFNVSSNPVTNTTTYTLVSVTDNNGCVRTSGFTGNSVTITVNSLPQGSLTANGPFCATGTGQLTWTATAGTGPFTIVYNDGVANRTQSNVISGTPFNVFTNPVTGTTTYTLVSVTDNNGCVRTFGFTRAFATITVNPLPQGSLSANGPFCSTGTGQLIWTATAGAGPFKVVYNDGVADRIQTNVTSGTAFNVFTNPVTNTTTYTIISVTDSKGCSRSSGFTVGTVAIPVYQPPVITSDPTDQTICSTFPATFTVTATGDGLTYQWYKGTTPLSDNDFITGSNSSTLTIDPTDITDSGAYHVVIKGLSPCISAISADAILKINREIVITTQPISQTLCEGSAATFSITATGTNLLYQWKKGGTNLTDGGNISGSNTPVLTISNISTADTTTSTTRYNVVISDIGSVCPTARSNRVNLVINPTSVGGAVSSDSTICSGNNNGILHLSGQTGNVIRWEYSTNGGSMWNTIANTSISQTYTNLTQTTQYRAVVQSGVCTPANSSSANISVNPVSVGGNLSGSTRVCADGNSGTITLSGQTGNVVRWEYSTNGGSTWNTIANTTTSQTYTNLTRTTMYRVVVQSGVCSAAYSSTAIVTVDPIAVGGTLSPATSFECLTSNNGTITLSGKTGSVLQWESSVNGGNTWSVIANTTTTQTYTNLTQTTMYRALIKSGVCPATAYSSNSIVIVNPPFTVTASANPASICLGESSLLIANGSTNTTPFPTEDFEEANPENWSGNNANNNNTLPNSEWGETDNNKVFNGITYNSDEIGKMMIVNGTTGAPGNTASLITPSFSLAGTSSATLKFNEAFNLNAGTTAKVEISIDGGITYNTLQTYTGPLNLGVSGNTANLTLNLASISLTPYLGSTDVKIRFYYTGTAGSNWAIDNVTVVAVPQPITYTWSPSTYLSSTTGQTVTATPTAIGTYKYTVKGTTGACSSTADVLITVNPLPNVSGVSASPGCDGSTATITLTGILKSNTSTIIYNINGGANDTVSVLANASGVGTFTVPVTLANNGQILNITKVTAATDVNKSTKCSRDLTISVPLVVNPLPTSVLTGSQIICNGGSGTITVSLTGTAPWTFTYSDGSTSKLVTTSSNPFSTSVSPTTTPTTYVITSLTDGTNCSATAAGMTGSAVITFPNGNIPGLWTGLVDNDWFNCRNWNDGKIPSITTDVTIPATTNSCKIDASVSPYVTPGTVAFCKNITIDNNTLSFIASSEKLFAAGNVTIRNNATVDMTLDGTLELQGNWYDEVNTTGKGFISGVGSVIFSGSATQSISAANTTELFYNLQINKTQTTGLVNLNNNVTADHNLQLIQGIFTTGNNLFTWNNSSGTLTAPEPDYTPNSTNYTKSFIATCDAAGIPITVADAYTPFTGNAGFKIKNVSSRNTYFPVGASYLPAGTSISTPSPNRVMIKNLSSGKHDFTVVVNYGDIGYTNGATDALRVNRIWYVNRSGSSFVDSANVWLFFTKRDWTEWGTGENEVEAGFNYNQAALVQKDYSPNRGAFINLSDAGDMPDFINNTYNTEIYGKYTIGVSRSLTNGIQQFNRFSVINPASIILPVTISNLKAYQHDRTIQIEWSALNEINMDHYEVERSVDGVNFSSIGKVAAINKGNSLTYKKIDPSPINGNNFYRVKAIDKNGAISYTAIVVVNIEKDAPSISIQPNPVQNRIINIMCNNMRKGKYQFMFYNSAGQCVFRSSIEHPGGSTVQKIILPMNTKPGVYVAKIFNNAFNFTIPVVVE